MKQRSISDALFGHIEKPLSFQEAQIRQASLTVPDDLIALRDVLDKGHNISRSDAYALLNHIDEYLSERTLTEEEASWVCKMIGEKYESITVAGTNALSKLRLRSLSNTPK